MAHRNARLTPFGRLLLVRRVLDEGWPVAHVAAAMGVSRAAAYRWVHRFRREGPAGLEDRSSRPQHSPRALSSHTERRILRARRRLRYGPHRLAVTLKLPRSTIYRVLCRHGRNRLADTDRLTGLPVRYVRERPGELLHLDVKKLGRIPDGGGHRMLGWEGRRKQGVGYDYLHVAVDDASRVAFVRAYPDERGDTAARFLYEAAAFFADYGVQIERVLTDRAWAYSRSAPFAAELHRLGARHLTTRPYRPQTNGKAERFVRTLTEEWAYRRLYPTNADRLAALPRWLARYNHRRPHTALGGVPPIAALVNNLSGKNT